MTTPSQQAFAAATAQDLFSAVKTVTLAAAAVANAIKTSFATQAVATSYLPVDFNGAIGAGVFPLPQTVSVTTGASAATYDTTDPIVVKGLDYSGTPVQDSLKLLTAGGGDVIKGTVAFAQVTEIDIPAQLGGGGTFQFGVEDVVLPRPARRLRATAAGNLAVGYLDGSTDTLPCLAGEQHPVLANKIFGTTSIGFTVYL